VRVPREAARPNLNKINNNSLKKMTDQQQLLKTSIEKGISYEEYCAIGRELLSKKRSSPSDTEEPKAFMLEYTELNLARMARLDKTIVLQPELLAQLAQLDRKITFLLVSEVWCGDAAQNVPLLAKIAEASGGKIELKIVWRDTNLALIDQYLTNNARMIPKLVVLDAENLEELATWGARPKEAQDLVFAYKANPDGVSYEDFVKNLHLWYTKNKTMSQQSEFQAIFAQILAKTPTA
jgi:hypothetical protein